MPTLAGGYSSQSKKSSSPPSLSSGPGTTPPRPQSSPGYSSGGVAYVNNQPYTSTSIPKQNGGWYNGIQYWAPGSGPQPTPSGGGGGGGGGVAQTGTNQQETAITNSTNDLMANLERDYTDSLALADTAQQGYQNQATDAINQLNTQAQTTKNDLSSQQATSLAGVSSQEQTANKQQTSALQQARDLFRQTQQGNIAQLSALGLSSSSVSEALAEKLGVETARRIAGVTGSTNEILQNLQGERARVNDYAAKKLTEIDQQVGDNIKSIQGQLLQGIQQINDARQMAATAKANGRATLLSQAQQQIAAIQANAQQFQQQLQLWQTQKAASLADASKAFTVTPTDFSKLNAAQSNVQNITGVGGQLAGYQPSYSIQPSGQFSLTLNPKKDQIENPFATPIQ